jgi:hypothetical protein
MPRETGDHAAATPGTYTPWRRWGGAIGLRLERSGHHAVSSWPSPVYAEKGGSNRGSPKLTMSQEIVTRFVFPPFILAVGFLPPLASAEWAESVKRPAPRALGPFLVAVFIGLILLAALLSQRQPSKPAPTRVIAPPSVDETIPHAAEGPAPLGTFTMPAALRRATQDLPASIRVSGFVCHHISSGRQIGRTERGTVVRILCDFDTRPYRVLVTPQNRLVIRPWSE